MKTDLEIEAMGVTTTAQEGADWDTRLKDAENSLIDYVDEFLTQEGIHLDEHAARRVRKCVAMAMMCQYEYDWDVLQDIALGAGTAA
jgi:hypothetical protein